MIRIEREQDDEEGRPIRPEASWFASADKARSKALTEGSGHKAHSRVYADDRIRRALEKLFHDKCAYCEGDAFGQADWDVEHFRPKGRVAERDEHPGYYWLAYSWENLYPSCQYCNQKRKDRARWGDTSRAASPAAGKLDQFPLGDESTRAMGPSSDHGAEDHLLLDPCKDRPEEHIRFGVRGDAQPLAGSLRGKATIAICHLNRSRLREQRRKRAAMVADTLRIFQTVERSPGAPAQLVQELRETLERHFLADSVPSAAVGRWVMRDPGAFAV
ncbi:MAG: hypothetical protein KDD47_16420 [Acidobacteria bacterium]|nr:hypothetical protein [Acidobacteriota bacterium]